MNFTVPYGIWRMILEAVYIFEKTSGKFDCLLSGKRLLEKVSAECSEEYYAILEKSIIKYIDKYAVSRLKSELLGIRGFSESNIKNMRLFYDEWSPYVNRQPMTDDLDVNGEGLLIAIRQPLAGEINWNEFISLGVTHSYGNIVKNEGYF